MCFCKLVKLVSMSNRMVVLQAVTEFPVHTSNTRWNFILNRICFMYANIIKNVQSKQTHNNISGSCTWQCLSNVNMTLWFYMDVCTSVMLFDFKSAFFVCFR